jgi:alpha-tubulin suppressor-like RCC1 family protein
MARQSYRLAMVGIALWAGLAGCGPNRSNDSQGTDALNQGQGTVTLNLQAEFPADPAALTHGLAKGTYAQVASVTVDVKNGATFIVTAQALTLTAGVWSGSVANLPLGVGLTFVGHAYNASSVEIFTGQTVKSLTGIADQVSIPMAVVDDGVSALLPRIDSLVSPNAVAPSSATGAVTVNVSGGTTEVLTVAITPGTGGGSFALTPSTGLVTLVGGTGTVTALYTAPSAAAVYTHTVRVTNSQGNYVERQFQVQVCAAPCGNPVTINTAPVITALGAQRDSGTNVTWTATVADDGPANQLVYQWAFDGGLNFTDPAANPAIMLAYTTNNYGLLRVTVKDNSGGAGALATTLAFFMPVNQFPSTASQVTVGSNGNWKQIATGWGWAMAIRQDGTLWGWGANDYGQLGLGFATGARTLVPTQVGNFNTWAEVQVGDSHTVARRTDGTIWTWGYNGYGNLGLGDTTNRSVPTQIQNASLTTAGPVTAVAAGNQHTLAIRAASSTDSSTTLWSWGYNGYGNLGVGDTSNRNSPVQVGVLTGWTAIAAEGERSIGIQAGNVWGWGVNTNGELGDATLVNKTTPVREATLASTWVKIATGENTTYAINSAGALYAWGYNNVGQLGIGQCCTASTTPVRVGLPSDVWLAVSGGLRFALAIKSVGAVVTDSAGTLWAFGDNNYSQLGVGDTGDRATPTQVGIGTSWRGVSAGDEFGFALQSTNSLWGWGRNDSGQLGLGTTTTSTVPNEVRQ